MKHPRLHNPTLLFVLPVVLENLLTTGVGLIFSSLIGGISGTALTTISQGNQVVTLLCSAATVLVSGSGILCARLLGEGEPAQASRVVEQATLLTLLSSAAVTVLCLLFAVPLMSLLMPGASPEALREGVAYLRVLILSLPFLLISNVLTGALRAGGDGRSPLFITAATCAVQLLTAILFLRVYPLEAVGAGLSYLACRLFSMIAAFFVLLRSHRYAVRLRAIFRPLPAVFRRILHVGVPTSIESIFVQAGYLIGGSMVIGLGAFEAAVYNVANTLYTFAALTQTVCSTVATTLIGQLIGAKEYARTKRTGWRIWQLGMAASLALSLLIALLGPYLTPLYSADPAVQRDAASALWAVFFMCIPAISLNALDPQLRVGGDVKYVMYVSIIAVWLIRLPLTWLLCYHWSFGAPGVFWANTVCLLFRVACNTPRYIRGKFLHMRV